MARNPEILIVDPDLDSRAETKRSLELAHFTVVGEAGYGIEAVTVAREHPPDIFIVSMEEPVARALQTIESLADAIPGAPTVIYSSLADAASVRRGMVAGARDYLIKPAKSEDMARAI
jgi:pilus assembly protein CpaE